MLNNAQDLKELLSKRNVNVQYKEVHEGHSWGHWRALIDDILVFFYPRS